MTEPARARSETAADVLDAREERAMPVAAAAAASSVDVKSRWLAPESWGETLIGVAKHGAIFSATVYSLNRLMGESMSLRQAVTGGLLMGAMTISQRRSGTLIAAMPSIVTGALVLGIAGVSAAVSVIAGAPAQETLGAAAVGGFLGSVMLALGLRARKRERSLDQGLAHERVAPVLVSREELRARLQQLEDAQRPQVRRTLRRMGVGLAGWFGIIAFPYEWAFGAALPEWSWVLLFFGFWGSLGLAMHWSTKQHRAFAERSQLICSACARPYFGTFGNARLMKNLAEAGHCPQCGARIVTDETP